jgi:antitoxin component YwqK of YwqJK toxin-antitoxin module
MKFFHAIVFLLFSITAFSQTSETYKGKKVNEKDAAGQKQGHWVILNSGGKFPGFAEGELTEEGNYLDNKKIGIWTKYYPGGIKKHELTFTNNQPNGYAKFYYKDGLLQEEGMWKDNKWVGEYRYYHENGNLFYNWVYNAQGKREGVQQYFHENGNLMIEGTWKEGSESGLLKEYYENGSVKAEKYFSVGTVNAGKVNGVEVGSMSTGKIENGTVKNYEQSKVFDDAAPKAKKLAESIKQQHQVKTTGSIASSIANAKEEKAANVGMIGDGQKTTYNKFGKPLLSGIFKNSMLVDGKENVYAEDGTYQKTYIVKEGKRVSEEVNKP